MKARGKNVPEPEVLAAEESAVDVEQVAVEEPAIAAE
jgi:hypothetical protein